MGAKPLNDSHAAAFVARFAHLEPELAARALIATWRQLSITEQAAIELDWSWWRRSKQVPPAGDWITWGFLTGRAFGKTLAISKYINQEVEDGRAPLILLVAQDEQSSIDIQVEGPSGLIATAKPWNRPEWHASDLELVWPNGTLARVRTPEVPGKIRGPEYHLAWVSELQSWPASTADEAFSNVELSIRLGYARILWDATPKKRHKILKQLLAQGAADPRRHVVVRGQLVENIANLARSYVEKLLAKYGGTQKGREELDGEMLEGAEGALFKQEWIERERRAAPERLDRRVIGVDPAVTDRKGSDTTGIVEVGRGTDGRAYVFGDASGKYKPEAWGNQVLDWYVGHGCDLILAETNKGGQLVATNLRALAKERRLEVVIVEKDERPSRQDGKVFVKEVYARGAKADRAEPVATAYERRSVSHVLGAALGQLEDTLTTWEPSPNADSPGDLDALVHACSEVLDLANDKPDPKAGFTGLTKAAEQLTARAPATPLARAISTAFGGRGDKL